MMNRVSITILVFLMMAGAGCTYTIGEEYRSLPSEIKPSNGKKETRKNAEKRHIEIESRYYKHLQTVNKQLKREREKLLREIEELKKEQASQAGKRKNNTQSKKIGTDANTDTKTNTNKDRGEKK